MANQYSSFSIPYYLPASTMYGDPAALKDDNTLIWGFCAENYSGSAGKALVWSINVNTGAWSLLTDTMTLIYDTGSDYRNGVSVSPSGRYVGFVCAVPITSTDHSLHTAIYDTDTLTWLHQMSATPSIPSNGSITDYPTTVMMDNGNMLVMAKYSATIMGSNYSNPIHWVLNSSGTVVSNGTAALEYFVSAAPNTWGARLAASDTANSYFINLNQSINGTPAGYGYAYSTDGVNFSYSTNIANTTQGVPLTAIGSNNVGVLVDGFVVALNWSSGSTSLWTLATQKMDGSDTGQTLVILPDRFAGFPPIKSGTNEVTIPYIPGNNSPMKLMRVGINPTTGAMTILGTSNWYASNLTSLNESQVRLGQFVKQRSDGSYLFGFTKRIIADPYLDVLTWDPANDFEPSQPASGSVTGIGGYSVLGTASSAHVQPSLTNATYIYPYSYTATPGQPIILLSKYFGQYDFPQVRYSGGAANTNPQACLGGAVSSEVVPSYTPAWLGASIAGIELVSVVGEGIGSGTLEVKNDTGTVLIKYAAPSLGFVTNYFPLDQDGLCAIYCNDKNYIVIKVTQASIPVAVSSETVTVNSTSQNIWDNVNASESAIGSTSYRCFFIHNSGSVSHDYYFGHKVIANPNSSTFAMGFDPSEVDSVQTIADENTAPVGISFVDCSDTTVEQQLSFTLAAGQSQAVWLRKVAQPRTTGAPLVDQGQIVLTVV